MNAVEQAYVEGLENEKSLLTNKCTLLSNENTQLASENNTLKEQLEWFRRQLFGKRSEKIIDTVNSQQLLFEGFEKLGPPTQDEKVKVPSHIRNKRKKDADTITLPPDLPVEQTILDLPEEEKVCPVTGKPLIKIGEEVTHKLAHQPGCYYIKQFVRPKYALPKGGEEGIRIASLPDTILPKCRADESLLAEIVVRKFADHLPLYRICEEFARNRVGVSRQLLSNWVVGVGLALEPLYQEMLNRILSSRNTFVDETPVNMLAPGKGKAHQGYMWILVGEGYQYYTFRTNRKHNNAHDLLRNYQGNLHSDKYAAYETLAKEERINWCPCFAHIRRKFFEVESGDLQFRDWMLRKLRYLFMFERVAWNRSPEERYQIRQEKEVPIIDELILAVKEKLHERKLLPKSKLREALGYFYSLVPYLKNYTKDPLARLDNNVAERAARSIAIGRKNWLFFGSERGGKAGSILLSLVQTCRTLEINPREYLEDVFRRIMGHPFNQLYELLPDEWARNRAASQDSS